MKKLLAILAVFSGSTLFGAYDSQYLKICLYNSLPGSGNPLKRLQTFCKNKDYSKLDAAKSAYQQKLNDLSVPFTREEQVAFKRTLDQVGNNLKNYIQQVDGKTKFLKDEYYDHVKYLIGESLKKGTSTRTVDDVFTNDIKPYIDEIIQLQFDAKLGQEIINTCNKTVDEKSTRILCNVALEPI